MDRSTAQGVSQKSKANFDYASEKTTSNIRAMQDKWQVGFILCRLLRWKTTSYVCVITLVQSFQHQSF